MGKANSLSYNKIQKLIKLARAGEKHSDIAREFGCAHSTVAYHCAKYGIARGSGPRPKTIPECYVRRFSKQDAPIGLEKTDIKYRKFVDPRCPNKTACGTTETLFHDVTGARA